MHNRIGVFHLALKLLWFACVRCHLCLKAYRDCSHEWARRWKWQVTAFAGGGSHSLSLPVHERLISREVVGDGEKWESDARRLLSSAECKHVSHWSKCYLLCCAQFIQHASGIHTPRWEKSSGLSFHQYLPDLVIFYQNPCLIMNWWDPELCVWCKTCWQDFWFFPLWPLKLCRTIMGWVIPQFRNEMHKLHIIEKRQHVD